MTTATAAPRVGAAATEGGDRVDRITLAHGDGGELTARLIDELFLKHLGSEALAELGDAAVVPLAAPAGVVAVTTDSFVVDPVFFPGGDIGKLAVCGTVNDLAAQGADPVCLTAGFIIEEGLPLADLERVAASMGATAREVGVPVVAGDTKVVGRGQADKLFINTSGVGVLPDGPRLGPGLVRPGDAVCVSGEIGNHGVAIWSRREGLAFDTPVVSDCAPLHGLARKVRRAAGDGLRVMRDPTRGGVATVLNEVAGAAGVDIIVEEAAVPVNAAVAAACDILGLDPLYLANEGRLVVVCAAGRVEAVLEAMRTEPGMKAAARIGSVAVGGGRVFLRTALGATRRLERLRQSPLPRIC